MIVWKICCFLALIWLFTITFRGPYILGENLGELFCGLVIGAYIVFVGITDFILQFLQEIHKATGKEWSLVDALSRDFQEAYRSVEQIERRANQVWETEALRLIEMRERLNEGEKRWKEETVDLLSDARRCDKERNSLKFMMPMTYFKLLISQLILIFKNLPIFHLILIFSCLLKFQPILIFKSLLKFQPIQIIFDNLLKAGDLAFAMQRAKRAILEYQKPHGIDCVRKSVALLEECRGRVRTLRDRPIDDANIDPPKQPLPSGVSRGLEHLVLMNPNLTNGVEGLIRSVIIQLNLLRALMEDLKAVRLESHMETVWLQRAQEIVDQAHEVIAAFLQETGNQIRWLSCISDYWRYGPKLKYVMKDINRLLTSHFEAKERYGFNFIVRGLSKDSILNLRHREDDGTSGAISSVVKKIRIKLLEHELERKIIPREVQIVAALLLDIQQLDKELKDQEKTDGAIQTRKASLSLLKRLLSELYDCVDKLRWGELGHVTRDFRLLKRCLTEIKVVDELCSTVGMKEDIQKLVLELTNERRGTDPLVIAIVGMRGVGKRTLAKEIRNHQSIAKVFPYRPWVTIPNTDNPIHLLQSVVTQIERNQETRTDIEHKTLVVLDGLLSKDAWVTLSPALTPNGSISAIVLITRDKEVASHANADYTHRHRLRTTEESWELFNQMVNIPNEPDVQNLAKKVVERTGGLPLAILRLGYLLSGKSITKEELLSSHDRISQGQNQSPWEDNLEMNMRDFQSQPAMESCLSYFQLFPKDFELPVRRLVEVQAAQTIPSIHAIGSANELDPVRTEERLAYKNLEDLIDRNIVQPIQYKHNGKVMSCRFPSIFKEIWLKGRQQKEIVGSWSLCASSERLVSYRYDHNENGIDGSSNPSLHSNILWEDNRPISITFLDSRKGSEPGQDISKFIVREMRSGNFQSLLILDLESVFKPKLPRNIGKLKQLRYLGLRWTYLEKLPDSVGQLSKLQTLDLRRTSLLSLPSSIWKLKTLQRLHLDHDFRIKDLPNHLSDISMKNLRKLSGGFVNSQGMVLLKSLYKLSNLQKLRLTFHLKPSEQDTMLKNILQLTHLQSLSLKSVNVSNEPQDLNLKNLASLQNLSNAYFFGKIADMCIFPRSLIALTFSASEFSRSHLLLEMLAQFPELKYLYFFSRSFVDSELVFVRDGFPKLLVLRLWALDSLVSLKVEEGAMPKIQEFEIRDCQNMTVTNHDYPTGLTRLRTLEELKFTDMPQRYVAFVVEEFAKAERQSSEEIVHIPIIKVEHSEALSG